MKNFTCVLFLTLLVAIAAQDENPAAAEAQAAPPSDEPRVELDQEAIEAIMRNVSPGCRSEIESAMETKTDVSAECQEEIQGSIQSLNIKPKTTRPKRSRKAKSSDDSAGDGNNADAEREERKKRRAKKVNSSEPMIHPAFTLVAYLALFLGAGFAFFKYNLAADDDSETQKTSGKKGKKNK